MTECSRGAAPLISIVVDDILSARRQHGGRQMVVGLCGCQGSGKSTLAEMLRTNMRNEYGLSVAVMSLDDLYFPIWERERLAREIHPLLRIRGVPGTHDVDLGIRLIKNLLRASSGTTVRIPRFDKAADRPRPHYEWEEFTGTADIIFFEGWCVGALPQRKSALHETINALEREFDQDGRWRHYVNETLAGAYQALFGLIDRLVMLRAPNFDVVFEWRRQQERALAALESSAPSTTTRIMNDEELQRFVMHYERLTRHILSEMPTRADLVIALDKERKVVLTERPTAR